MSSSVMLTLFSRLTSKCTRESQCHSGLVITLAHRMLPGQRYLCSGTLTPAPRQAPSHHRLDNSESLSALSSTGGSSKLIQQMVGGANYQNRLVWSWSSAGSRGGEREGERMSQTRDDREFKWRGKEGRLKGRERRRDCWLWWWWEGSWGCQTEKLGWREWEEARGMWKEGRETRGRNFSITAHRQQRPRFQETITVCSPEGKAHLASFISSILSPRKLQVGIFNVFLLLHKQTQASHHYRCPEWHDQIPGEANPPFGRIPETLAQLFWMWKCFSADGDSPQH